MANLGEYLGAGSGTTKLLLHLNGNSTDSSGNGNTATSSGVSYGLSYGKFGQGASFPGSSAYINYPSSASLDSRSTTTMSCWVNIQSLPASGASQVFFSRGVGDGFGMFLRVENVGGTIKLKGSVVVTSPDTMYAVEGLVPSTNTWYNIVGVFDSPNQLLYLYVNGDGQGSTKTTAGTVMRLGATASQKGAIIGAYSTSNQAVLNGYIDECIIENRAWTASEVKKYYTYAKGRFNN